MWCSMSRARDRKQMDQMVEFVKSWDAFVAAGALVGKIKSPEVQKHFEAARDRCVRARNAIGELKA